MDNEELIPSSIRFKSFVNEIVGSVKLFLANEPRYFIDCERNDIQITHDVLELMNKELTSSTKQTLISGVVEKWMISHSEQELPKNGFKVYCRVQKIFTTEDHKVIYAYVEIENSNIGFKIPINLRDQELMSILYCLNRRIVLTTKQIEKDYMIVQPCMAIYLTNSQEDVDIFTQHYNESVNLKSFNISPIIPSILVRIKTVYDNCYELEDDTMSGGIFLMTNGSNSGYSELFDVNDIILMLNIGFAIESDNTPYFFPRQETIMIIMPQDGTPSSSRTVSVDGIVKSITHQTLSDSWIGCTMLIETDIGIRQITARSFDGGFTKGITHGVGGETGYRLVNIRANHSIWAFGLQQNFDGTLEMTPESAIFNLSCMSAFHQYLAARPVPIRAVGNFRSAVIRAIVVSFDATNEYFHSDCGSLLPKFDPQVASGRIICPCCRQPVGFRFIRSLFFRLHLDDGTGSIKATARPSAFVVANISEADVKARDLTEADIKANPTSRAEAEDLAAIEGRRRRAAERKDFISLLDSVETGEDTSEEDSDLDEIARLVEARYAALRQARAEEQREKTAAATVADAHRQWALKVAALVGQEFVFFISQTVFAESDADWRVDQTLSSTQETSILVAELINQLRKT